MTTQLTATLTTGETLPAVTTDTPWRGRTQSGYGNALPTPYMVRHGNRWKRVKAICYSNASTLYFESKSQRVLISSID